MCEVIAAIFFIISFECIYSVSVACFLLRMRLLLSITITTATITTATTTTTLSTLCVCMCVDTSTMNTVAHMCRSEDNPQESMLSVTFPWILGVKLRS